MSNVSLSIVEIADQTIRENFRKLQEFINEQSLTNRGFQAVEIYVTDNVTGAKVAHKLGGVPLDAILTRLIAPSAARLALRFTDFTKNEIIFNVTGLSSGETLNARLLIGTFSDVVSVGDVVRVSDETQELRSKF